MKTTFALALLACLAAQAMAQTIHKGMGTAYSAAYDMDATGQNMCEYNPRDLNRRWQVYYGAMNQDDWNKFGGKDNICGKCIVVRGVKGETTPGHVIKPIYVKIVDQCPDWACDPGNVDFSITALRDITGYGWDKKKIEWSYVDCPVGDENPVREVKEATTIAARAAVAAKQAATTAKRLAAVAAEKSKLSAAAKAQAAASAADKAQADADLAEKTRIEEALKAEMAGAAQEASNAEQPAATETTETVSEAAPSEEGVSAAKDATTESEVDSAASQQSDDKEAALRQVAIDQAASDKAAAEAAVLAATSRSAAHAQAANAASAAASRAAQAAASARTKAAQLAAKAKQAAKIAAEKKKDAPF